MAENYVSSNWIVPETSEKKVTLKLLVDKKARKVLFAEAGKDFVDFLFHLFSLPMATVVRLVTKQNMVGSLGKLYESMEVLDNEHLQPNMAKENVLKPGVASRVPVKLQRYENDELKSSSSSNNLIYSCSYEGFCNGRCLKIYTDDPRTLYPFCKSPMSFQMRYISPSTPKETLTTINESFSETSQSGQGIDFSRGGYVKGAMTYMVMDDLEVKPMSTISAISFINQCNVKNTAILAEREVKIGLS